MTLTFSVLIISLITEALSSWAIVLELSGNWLESSVNISLSFPLRHLAASLDFSFRFSLFLKTKQSRFQNRIISYEDICLLFYCFFLFEKGRHRLWFPVSYIHLQWKKKRSTLKRRNSQEQILSYWGSSLLTLDLLNQDWHWLWKSV